MTKPASLATALERLAEAARAAGLDPDAAREEGRILSAAVAEGSPGAFVDWCRETHADEGAEDFMRAASAGRRFRTSPTVLQSQLRNCGSDRAQDYANALGEVCAAAALLGQPTAQTAGAATMAAAAQMGSADNAAHSASPLPAASPVVDPNQAAPEQDFLRRAPGLLQQVLGQLQASNNRQLRDNSLNIGPRSPSVGFDLGDLDAHAPGAFDLTGAVSGAPGPSPREAMPPSAAPGGTPAPTGAPAPASAEAEPAQQDSAAADEAPDKGKSVEELLAELDALVGLDTVKTEIRKQAAVLRVEALRHQEGLKSPTLTRHLVFVGNPGTGKTTVARLVGGIYKALGLLSKGQLVEVDRAELVAGYLGQTAMKTADVCKKAKGGVLFIDEAYSLNGDQYGEEAINTLVKEMEDNRDDLVVIVAGYTAPMETFIANNPGLNSRFRTTLTFEDYSDDQLVEILTGMADGADYELGDGCEATFRNILGEQLRDETFGNGRFARNCLEAAIGRHAWRLRDVEKPTLAELKTLLPQDFRDPSDPTGPDGTVPWPPVSAVASDAASTESGSAVAEVSTPPQSQAASDTGSHAVESDGADSSDPHRSTPDTGDGE